MRQVSSRRKKANVYLDFEKVYNRPGRRGRPIHTLDAFANIREQHQLLTEKETAVIPDLWNDTITYTLRKNLRNPNLRLLSAEHSEGTKAILKLRESDRICIGINGMADLADRCPMEATEADMEACEDAVE
jgi:hypothetical protein